MTLQIIKDTDFVALEECLRDAYTNKPVISRIELILTINKFIDSTYFRLNNFREFNSQKIFEKYLSF